MCHANALKAEKHTDNRGQPRLRPRLSGMVTVGVGVYQCEDRDLEGVPQLLHQEPRVQVWDALSLKAGRIRHCDPRRGTGPFCPYFINTDKWDPILTSRWGTLELTVRKIYKREGPHVHTSAWGVPVGGPIPGKQFFRSRSSKGPAHLKVLTVVCRWRRGASEGAQQVRPDDPLEERPTDAHQFSIFHIVSRNEEATRVSAITPRHPEVPHVTLGASIEQHACVFLGSVVALQSKPQIPPHSQQSQSSMQPLLSQSWACTLTGD